MFIIKKKIKSCNNDVYEIIMNDKPYILKKIKKNKKTFNPNLINNLDSKYVIHYEDVYDDDDYIYIIMKCYPTDLFEAIGNITGLDDIKHIFAQIVTGIDYLHKQNILHLDIKPENILLTDDNLVKITDFDLSLKTTDINNNCFIFRGTYEYVPGEALRKEGFNYKFDIYSLGILLYEMLTDHKAYSFMCSGDTIENLNRLSYMKYNNIIPDLDDGSSLSNILQEIGRSKLHDDAIDLIKNMTKYPPDERYNIEDIKNHDWFTDLDWDKY